LDALNQINFYPLQKQEAEKMFSNNQHQMTNLKTKTLPLGLCSPLFQPRLHFSLEDIFRCGVPGL
jgi:hypothetical protein